MRSILTKEKKLRIIFFFPLKRSVLQEIGIFEKKALETEFEICVYEQNIQHFGQLYRKIKINQPEIKKEKTLSEFHRKETKMKAKNLHWPNSAIKLPFRSER